MNDRTTPADAPGALPQQVELAHRALHRIEDAAGLELACHEGTVWITLDHDPRDIVLDAGQCFAAAAHEHRAALVYALQDARFTIAAARRCARRPVRAQPAAPTSVAAEDYALAPVALSS